MNPQPVSFLDSLSPQDRADLSFSLDAFLVGQHPRPVTLVTSGGTAVDLEQNTVRTLENFSTGWRGAVAVEGLLRQGYAVVHLQRTGCTAPFARVLVEELGAKAHQAIDLEALDQLLGTGNTVDDDDKKAFVETVAEDDPWLTQASDSIAVDDESAVAALSTAELHVRRNLVHSSRLQHALQERVAFQSRLCSIPFRTVQEYLAKLEICATALQATAGSRALIGWNGKCQRASGTHESALAIPTSSVPELQHVVRVASVTHNLRLLQKGFGARLQCQPVAPFGYVAVLND
jgi:hypothetical protein